MEDKREVFTTLRGSALILFFFYLHQFNWFQTWSFVYIPLAFLFLIHPFYCVFLLPYRMLYIVFVLTISNAAIAIMCLGITYAVVRALSESWFSGFVLIQSESHNTWLRVVRVRHHAG